MPTSSSSRLYLSLLAIIASLVVSPSAIAAWPGSNGRIVYRALELGFEAEGKEPVGLAWTSGRPGSAPHPLTADPTDADPQISPDGRTVVFSRSIDLQGLGGHSALFTIQFDGSGLRQLTDPPQECWDGKASFDPRGSRLFFIRHCRAPERGTDTWSIGLDGSDLKKPEGPRARGGASVASPTGRQVLFVSRTDTGSRLISMRPDGSRRRDLTPRIGREQSIQDPDFSPDGRLIVFSGSLESDLFTMRADGRGLRRLSDLRHKPGHDPPDYAEPAFSPNGREVVAIARGRSGPPTLVRFEVGGDGSARGVAGVRYGEMPVWAPRLSGR